MATHRPHHLVLAGTRCVAFFTRILMAAGGGGGAGDPEWYTGAEAIGLAYDTLQRTFDTGVTRPLEWRRRQIAGIKRLVEEHEEEIVDAIHEDMKRPRSEARVSDTIAIMAEAQEFLDNLGSWLEPEVISTPLGHVLSSSEIRSEPLGTVLIIAPWNYPVNLTLSPLIAALAAGNCVMVKPSELSPVTTQLLTRLLPMYVDPMAVQVVNGGPSQAKELLARKWDHIFFTGGEFVGKIVMRAAAEHLTPVTLELGGKSPAIVCASADLTSAARRIIQGRCFNAGQSCLAADYVLVEKSVSEQLCSELVGAVAEFFGEDPHASASYGRLINARHFQRVKSMLEEEHGGEILSGGADKAIDEDLYLPPTIVLNPNKDARMCKEEIFGPILPVLEVDSLAKARDYVRSRPKPLGMYVFTTSAREREVVLEAQSGDVVQNDTLIHFSNSDAPFGGVGTSGMGAYHGKHGLHLFSHKRTVVYARSWTDPLFAIGRYPPYSDSPAIESILWLMYMKPSHALTKTLKWGAFFAAIALAAYLGHRAGKEAWTLPK